MKPRRVGGFVMCMTAAFAIGITGPKGVTAGELEVCECIFLAAAFIIYSQMDA
jgi:hypothetical protein